MVHAGSCQAAALSSPFPDETASARRIRQEPSQYQLAGSGTCCSAFRDGNRFPCFQGGGFRQEYCPQVQASCQPSLIMVLAAFHTRIKSYRLPRRAMQEPGVQAFPSRTRLTVSTSALLGRHAFSSRAFRDGLSDGTSAFPRIFPLRHGVTPARLGRGGKGDIYQVAFRECLHRHSSGLSVWSCLSQSHWPWHHAMKLYPRWMMMMARASAAASPGSCHLQPAMGLAR